MEKTKADQALEHKILRCQPGRIVNGKICIAHVVDRSVQIVLPGLEEQVKLLEKRFSYYSAFLPITVERWEEEFSSGIDTDILGCENWWLALDKVLDLSEEIRSLHNKIGELETTLKNLTTQKHPQPAKQKPNLPECEPRAEEPKDITVYEVEGDTVRMGEDLSITRKDLYVLPDAKDMTSTFDIDNVESVRYFVDNWFADNWYEYNFHRMKTPLKGKEEVYPEDVEVYRSELFAALKGKKRAAFNEALQHFIDSYPSSESDQYAMSYASPRATLLKISARNFRHVKWLRLVSKRLTGRCRAEATCAT